MTKIRLKIRADGAAFRRDKSVAWRGLEREPISPEVLDDYTRRGNIITERTPLSTTTLSNPADAGFSDEIVIEVQSKTGKNIHLMSANEEQREVLFRAGTTFRVLNSHPTEDGKIKTYWEEMTP